MTKKLIIILFVISLVGCATIKTNIMEPEAIEVGNLSKAERYALWDAAKNKCFDIEYNITSEDRNAGNLICQTKVGSGTWTLAVKITESGFKVTHQSNELIDALNPYLTERKKDMESTLSSTINATKTNQPEISANVAQKTDGNEADAADNHILKAQKRLIQLGYDPGTPDGLNGTKTKNAITIYQKNMGLLPTGELNSATISALEIK